MTPEPEQIHDCQLYRGEALEILRHLPDELADALITDPPYSSGGFTRTDRNQSPAKKYIQTGTKLQRENFAGDNRDQRSWHYWCTLRQPLDTKPGNAIP